MEPPQAGDPSAALHGQTVDRAQATSDTAPRPARWGRLTSWLFEGELPQTSPALRGLAALARLVTLAAVRFWRDRGQEKAASLAYSTLLALIPLLVLAV